MTEDGKGTKAGSEATPKPPEGRAAGANTPAVSVEERVAELEKGLKAAQDEAKAHQKVATRKNQELEDATGRLRAIEAEKVEWQFLQQNPSLLAGDEETTGEATKSRVTAKQALTEFRKLQRQESQRAEATRKMDELKKVISDAGEDPADDIFEEADAFAQLGRYSLAHRKIDAIIKAKKAEGGNGEEGGETEAQKIEKKARELLVKTGALKPEGGSPSAPSGTITREDWTKMPVEERVKNLDAMRQSIKEGHLK